VGRSRQDKFRRGQDGSGVARERLGPPRFVMSR